MTTPVWIGLGSNLGDRKATLDAAVAALADAPGVVVRAVSSYHETAPVGGPPGQGAFLNAAARLETTLGPFELLAVTQDIENRLGRVRTVRWGERTLDLDILIYDSQIQDTEQLKLPHPRLALRRFVLAPLAEIAPTVMDPVTRRTIADLLANLDRRPRLVAIDCPAGEQRANVFRRLVEQLPGFGISEREVLGPEQDQRGDAMTAHFDNLDRKAEALKTGHWAAETLRVPWLVADYFLGVDILRTSTTSWWRQHPGSESKSLFDAQRERVQQATLGWGWALAPTFVVVLSGDREMRRAAGLAEAPQLWPDSDDPDAIVAEVVATCRAIEGA